MEMVRDKRYASSTCSYSSQSSSTRSNCRICLSSFMDPAALSCGHRFCESCLDKYWQAYEKPDCIKCPLCRGDAYNVDFTKPRSGPTDFRKMFATESIYEECSPDSAEKNLAVPVWIKITILTMSIYFFLRVLRPVISDLFHFIQFRLGYGYKL